jgi:hypothetical protein
LEATLADFWGLKLPHTHDVGLVGEEPSCKGLDTADAHREATQLSQSRFFERVASRNEDGKTKTYLFGQEWKLFG